MERFKQRKGHCRVYLPHQEDGLNLGKWVNKQRTKKDTMSPERVARLDQLGFRWDPHDEDWEANFAALERFKQHVGHCRVPRPHQVDGLNLGSWVGTQRAKKDTLSPEQIARLNALGFVWKL